MTVVDIDDPDPSWVSKAEERFGKTNVRVRTPSGGIHLYYAGQFVHPPKLKREGWPVDIKTGSNQYVACAGSWRADGRTYFVEGAAIAQGALPLIQDNDAAPVPTHRRQKGATNPKSSAVAGAVVPVGQRHDYLIGHAKLLARNVKSETALLDALKRVFELECDTSAPLETEELEEIARWCWKLQQEGQNYIPGESDSSTPCNATMTADGLDRNVRPVLRLPPLFSGVLRFSDHGPWTTDRGPRCNEGLGVVLGPWTLDLSTAWNNR